MKLFSFREWCQQPLLHFFNRGRDRRPQVFSVPSQKQDANAPVVGRGPAFNHAARFKPVDHPCNGGGVQRDLPGQGALIQPRVVVGGLQDGPLNGRDLVRIGFQRKFGNSNLVQSSEKMTWHVLDVIFGFLRFGHGVMGRYGQQVFNTRRISACNIARNHGLAKSLPKYLICCGATCV